jgi:hypothetical protein
MFPTPLEALQQRIAPLQQQLAAHPLYSTIQTVDQLRTLMESHVFAVWDFMCLLKSLQRALTCVSLAWTPSPYPASRRFINEIVLGEESDEYAGRPLSHFEIYLEAMERAGASTDAIRRAVEAARLSQGNSFDAVDNALQGAPAPARQFVQTTFRIISQGSIAAQAAAFTFGREDAIPGMFRSLVRDLNSQMDGDLSQFIWYLERHIEVDGDEHGPLSLRMVADLCGDDPQLWAEATQAAEDSILARLALWDGVLAQNA